jgi:disease resistance protein RPS2
MCPIFQKEDSWNLFCWHAFGATNCNVPHGLEEVAHLVVQECKGVPLVLKVIGGTMFGEIDVEQCLGKLMWNNGSFNTKY